MLWLFEQFSSNIRLNDIVKTHLSFNGIERMLYTLTFLLRPCNKCTAFDCSGNVVGMTIEKLQKSKTTSL